jgi:hypothetical protein
MRWRVRLLEFLELQKIFLAVPGQPELSGTPPVYRGAAAERFRILAIFHERVAGQGKGVPQDLECAPRISHTVSPLAPIAAALFAGTMLAGRHRRSV